jgi:hypothetical protein
MYNKDNIDNVFNLESLVYFMQGKIILEELVARLEKGTGFKHIDNEELGYYHYEYSRFIFGNDDVVIIKTQGYSGEEDMSSEWFDGEWKCTVPRKLAEDAITQLLSTGRARLDNVPVFEKYSGRRAYGVPDSKTLSYDADIGLTLQDTEPLVSLSNSKGTSNADRL